MCHDCGGIAGKMDCFVVDAENISHEGGRTGADVCGLSNAWAAATLAAVLVGYNIILPSGERLLNEDVLNEVPFC